MDKREPVLVVVNNYYERRYFYSARQAAAGLGQLIWPSPNRPEYGEVQVYRLDQEATDTLMAELLTAPRDHDPRTGKWLPAVKKRFQTIIQNVTGIKPS